MQQPKFIINFRDYKPNRFLFDSRWTMFHNAAQGGTMQGNVLITLL
jgi:hypothetical protein